MSSYTFFLMKLKKFSFQKRPAPKYFDSSDEESSDEEQDDIRMKTPPSDILKLQCNPFISTMIEIIKPPLREISECCNSVRSWMQLLVPQMSDGNNFGVGVQNEMLEYVKRLELDSCSTLQAFSLYHLTRAEIVARFSRYPGVQDYCRALEELDVKEFIQLRLIARQMRNSCYALQDMVKKNMDKVMKPRAETYDNMLVC